MQLVKVGQLNSRLLLFIPFHRILTVRSTSDHFCSDLKELLIFTVSPRSEVSLQQFVFFTNSGRKAVVYLYQLKPHLQEEGENQVFLHTKSTLAERGIPYLYLILTEQGGWSWSP